MSVLENLGEVKILLYPFRSLKACPSVSYGISYGSSFVGNGKNRFRKGSGKVPVRSPAIQAGGSRISIDGARGLSAPHSLSLNRITTKTLQTS